MSYQNKTTYIKNVSLVKGSFNNGLVHIKTVT